MCDFQTAQFRPCTSRYLSAGFVIHVHVMQIDMDVDPWSRIDDGAAGDLLLEELIDLAGLNARDHTHPSLWSVVAATDVRSFDPGAWYGCLACPVEQVPANLTGSLDYVDIISFLFERTDGLLTVGTRVAAEYYDVMFAEDAIHDGLLIWFFFVRYSSLCRVLSGWRSLFTTVAECERFEHACSSATLRFTKHELDVIEGCLYGSVDKSTLLLSK